MRPSPGHVVPQLPLDDRIHGRHLVGQAGLLDLFDDLGYGMRQRISLPE
ncbi:MAG: hypothetical protein WEA34_12855 [Gemmatimonadota bacterium]